MSDWQSIIREEWKRRSDAKPKQEGFFPLIAQSFDDREIVAVVDTLLTGQLTMAKKVKEFETEFAKKLKAPFAVMVNSGSSANLLAFAAAANPAREKHLKRGDEVLVPAVCWSTSVWPIIQMGMVPVFVDVDPKTLNVDLHKLKNKITPKTKAIVAVHILGNSAPMAEFLKICFEYNLIVIEDTCESLGSKANGKYLGTQSDFGTFSFYYSHHITTGEGGMVLCHSQEDYDLLKCLRAHGWSREMSSRKELEELNSNVDPRFLFVNLGYNFRPMEIQAAFGLHQLDRLNEMNIHRNSNRENLMDSLKTSPRWKNQLSFIEPSQDTNPAWFGFPCLISEKYAKQHRAYLSYLSECGVENRPIVSGNFARQPALKLLGVHCDPKDFPGAEIITTAGFFIGLHTEAVSSKTIKQLTDILLGFKFDD
jgi:CDP-6-deoxy-D-xylo-4-hexulose-3-dehydrase